ncbi:DUF3426 domain-containing protein [Pseudohongiella sp.]|uniref:DUF3426 domain-containing protein n=1 Tax=marine sediment metagenome TaxID=412755 RepID=A0A0F9Z4S3_9ZZZZ|nr:DUF3426 domain-containing protein [Pseudohongiella sp.]HDZ09380.1 DUF3426 domain-containing protein [Pseudohongiella sp.]HEA63771.1 DUF3426 domain-containing protein [Pseudohongiella sp.]
MWTLVETDTAPDNNNGTFSGALTSRLPDPDESGISAALSAPAGRTPFWRAAGYAGLCLLLTASLIAQIGYQHLDRISQHGIIRPWLLALCDVADCVLPARQDSSRIVSNQLSIEPHPDFQDISQMVLSFTNAADFAQPLPAIDLVFSDTTGRETAGRRFYPQDYYPRDHLDAAAASPTALSAQESLTIQLAFATPADDAVNYQVRFAHE